MTERIDSLLTQAMRDGDSITVSVLRMLKAALQNARIASGAELTGDQMMDVVRKEVKLRRDAVVSYEVAGRAELAAREKSEIQILTQFLPPAPTQEQVEAAVQDAISNVSATGSAEMGKVIGAVKQALGGGADGAAIAAEVKRQLNGG